MFIINIVLLAGPLLYFVSPIGKWELKTIGHDVCYLPIYCIFINPY